MNDYIKKPLGWMDTDISIRPKPRKPIVICKDPERAIAIMNKNHGTKYPLGKQ